MVLDLDRTLVHLTPHQTKTACESAPVCSFYFRLLMFGNFKVTENGVFRCYATKRPGLDEFLKSTAQDYNLCLFTSAKRRVIFKPIFLTRMFSQL